MRQYGKKIATRARQSTSLHLARTARDVSFKVGRRPLSPQQLSRREDARVTSLMSKLGRVFNGGKQNVNLQVFPDDGTPYTSLETREVQRGPIKVPEDWYTVHLPSYSKWTEARTMEARAKKQDPDEEMIYRLYKGSAWHEQQHVQFSPPQFLKGGVDKDFQNSRTKRQVLVPHTILLLF